MSSYQLKKIKNSKQKLYIIGAILCMYSNLYSEPVSDNEVEIDMTTQTMNATKEVEVNYGDMKINLQHVRKDVETNSAYFERPFSSKINSADSKIIIDAQKGKAKLDGTSGEFEGVYGSLDVSRMTGAEYPNNNIYFGGAKTIYSDNNLYVTDGWFTTDPKIKATKQPESAGYTLRAKKIEIIPQKQITLQNIDLYNNEKSYVPFSFPWYRFNIRKNSLVPLFPSFGTNEDYGFYISQGILYGNSKDKFVGGFAPKFSDKNGYMIGRFENWYRTDNYGTFKLNMDDVLVSKKHDDTQSRYKLNLLQDYNGQYGTANLDILNATNNMVPENNDIIKRYDYSNSWEKLGVSRMNPGGNTQYYNLATKLDKMGYGKDISFESKLNLVSDRESYDLAAFEITTNGIVSTKGDSIYGGASDVSLGSDLKLYKDNSNYKIGGYYNQLDDLTPGISSKSLNSKNETYGFVTEDKVNKIKLSYDKNVGDLWRPLTFMEKNGSLTPTAYNNLGTPLGDGIAARNGNYSLVTVPEYTTFNDEKFNFSAGEKYGTAGFDFASADRELSLLEDISRNSIVGNNRDQELNRYNNIAFVNSMERRGYGKIKTQSGYSLTVGGGNSQNETWDREGKYNYTSLDESIAYKKYVTNSDFADATFETSKYNTALGSFKGTVGGRYDDYTKKYVTEIDEKDLANKSFKLNGTVENYSTLFKTGKGSADNTISYSGQNYNNQNILLTQKENFDEVKDKLNFDYGSAEGTYEGSFKTGRGANDNLKNNENYNNKLSYKLTSTQSGTVKYNLNKNYTDENINKINTNNLTFENYGGTYSFWQNTVGYEKDGISSNITNILNVDDSKENIETNKFTYGYDFVGGNKVTFTILNGSDIRTNYTQNIEELNIDKKSYGMTFLDFGPVYENKYSATYGTNTYNLSSYSTEEYSLGYSFLDKSMDPLYLKDYASREFDKDADSLTAEDMSNIARIMEQRSQNKDNSATSNLFFQKWKSPISFNGDFNRKFNTDISLSKNKERYKQTGDFMQSLQSGSISTSYTQRRIGLGYAYSETVQDTKKWEDSKTQQHTMALNLKIGKPSQGYSVTTYAKYNKNWYSTPTNMSGAYGIELGKEMGYYGWSIVVTRGYTYDSKELETSVALQFKLLTFPDKAIFGFGGNKKSNENTSPKVYVGTGLDVTKVD